MWLKFTIASKGSKIILFVTKKPIKADKENNIDDKNNGFFNFLIAKKVPEAAIPNKAILTIINAKWYHCDIEKNLIKLISKAKVAKEIKNMP